MKEGIIFGAGKVGRKVYVPLTLKYNIKVIAYVDNSISLQGNMLYDVPIISCGEIAKLCYDLIFIALYDLDQINEVRQQLAQQGVANEKIVVLATDLSYMQVFMDQRFVWIKGYADWIYGMGGAEVMWQSVAFLEEIQLSFLMLSSQIKSCFYLILLRDFQHRIRKRRA